MKKIFYFLLVGGMFLSSCELEDDGTENGGGSNNNDGGGNNNSEVGLVGSFDVSLNYNSTNPSALSSFDVDNLEPVAANSSAADVSLCWQNQYGYVITSPNGTLIKQLYDFNDKSYSNSNNTTIQNLGQVNIDSYNDASSLKGLSVSSGSIADVSGKNQVIVNSGDVIAFQKGNIKGVGKVSVLSKVTKKVYFKGYVYNPSAAK